LLKRWVVIAKDRKKRPTDFIKQQQATENKGACPLCPENEHMTPPAVLVYLSDNCKIRKEKDTTDVCHKNWLVRVIPNLYPAFSPPTKQEIDIQESSVLLKAAGHHEVIVESPCHDEAPGVARISQLIHLLNAYLDRLETLSAKPYVKHVALFKNYGQKAGASLSHTHTQLIASPIVPTILEDELTASEKYWNQNQECQFCKIIKQESEGPRFIWRNKSFIVFAPWASINPLEFWVFPKKHNSNMSTMTSEEIADLAETIRVCLGALRSKLADPSYNFGFHSVLREDSKDSYHWHLEVYPRLSIWAGFEKSTGMYINAVSPEDAAKELRSSALEEIKRLKCT
jgi:UDPglucose--hexose-1-phosphate uridylyltransferase